MHLEDSNVLIEKKIIFIVNKNFRQVLHIKITNYKNQNEVSIRPSIYFSTIKIGFMPIRLTGLCTKHGQMQRINNEIA